MAKTKVGKKSQSEANSTASKSTRKDIFFVDLSQTMVLEGFNQRTIYKNMDWLVESIQQDGIRDALRAYKKDGIWVIVSGHRRIKAAEILAERGINVKIPIYPEPKGTSEIDRICSQVTDNSQEPYTPVEQAAVMFQLLNHGLSIEEIAARLNFSVVYVSNLLTLNSTPKKLKDLINKDTITSTLALQILREEKDHDKAIELIEKAMENVKSSTGKQKVTLKNIQEVQGKVNSLVAVRKVLKIKDRVVKQDRIKLHAFLCGIMDGKYDTEYLINELYEPIKEESHPELFEEGQSSED